MQSNGYDLGLFDQWLWLLSKGLPPYSSIHLQSLHVMADHGAWILYPLSLLYKIKPSIYWLFVVQALALSFTSFPLAILAKKCGLSHERIWLVCGIWWLQPIVFNINLFDFHPEVLVAPVIVLNFLASRNNNLFFWLLTIFVILGARDGLILLVLGMSVEQLFRRRYLWSFLSFFLASNWLLFLRYSLYPLINTSNEEIYAIENHFSYLGSSMQEIVFNILTKPTLILQTISSLDIAFYFLILCLPFVPFWRFSSLVILTSAIPLLIVNSIAESFSFRSLVHHYSLPLSIIGTVAAIDGLARIKSSYLSLRWSFFWIFLTWGLLAKPMFFIGPYLSRLNLISSADDAFSLISNDSRVLTTSYLVPHLSQRESISFPINNIAKIDDFDILLLNPSDPGWLSDSDSQQNYIDQANSQGWLCNQKDKGLTLCARSKDVINHKSSN